MDQTHAEELKELAEQGLVKMNLRGIGKYETLVIVHKNVPNKIAKDFIEKEQEISTFIDRDAQRPAKCYLFKSSCPMPSTYIQSDDIQSELQQEDDELKNCTTLVLRKEDI